MNTKEKILLAALRLFNTDGINVITIRHIAKDLGISHSNIQYYFKNADEIIFAIYQQHLQELNQLTSTTFVEEITLEALKQSVTAILRILYAYRFIYIDYVVIARRIPEIQVAYLSRYQLRREQLFKVFDVFRQKGIFRNDVPDEIWESLMNNIYTLGDFWIPANELTRKLDAEQAIAFYAGQIYHLIYPYLTSEGRK